LSERTHDVIFEADLHYVRADCIHDPGALVTKYRQRWNEIVHGNAQVGVTEP
jgi:hypothetical protein